MFYNFFFMHQVKETYLEYTLEMGQIKASADPAILTCYGLGSCVGVFLYDRLNKVGGGAHITLPAYNEFQQVESKLHYADCAIETLLYRMRSLGASTISLRAKVVGGSNISGFSNICVGLKNIESVRSILSKKGIFLAGNDVGGKAGRRARFNTQTGNLEVTNESTTYIV
jgi:chemotaxis protein CheD